VKWNCEEADRVSNLIAEMLVEADPEMKIETKQDAASVEKESRSV